MDYNLMTSARSEMDLEKVIKYYCTIRKDLARQFLSELRITTAFIQKNPMKIQIRYANVRVVFLDKFPYGVHYLFKNRTVTILSILHTSQDSDKWIHE